ncbi:GNAT family N-acetyltransferase [Colwellia psychrerythraea]|uniref:GCN5-related N-acetyltransferase n=1 Tax=Colwellia psychrerythraea TaxID=28229 RepID=A0A099KG09_COLPS|nr:GNAT family N-acetyltransferase [Colwellia psychrerythraea]KGJ89694.1 GCN5-related N-acetyltransferase [Colwellia psychrerythraea]
MHSFTTQRLLIRPLLAEDETFFCQQYSNEKVMRHNGGAITPVEANKAFIRSLKANNRAINGEKKTILTWAIICKSNNTIIGTQTFSFLIRPHNAKIMSLVAVNKTKQAEIGIVLSLKANGKLFPEEAMGALMEYGFTHLKFDKINAFYASKNLATKRFVKKLGFIYNPALQNVDTHDSYQYANKNQWQQKLIYQLY